MKTGEQTLFQCILGAIIMGDCWLLYGTKSALLMKL